MRKAILAVMLLALTNTMAMAQFYITEQCFSPTLYEVCTEQTFKAYVFAHTGRWSNQILGMHVQVSFDTDMLQVVDVMPGDWIYDQGCTALPLDLSTNDYVDFCSVWLGCRAHGSGVFAEIEFQAQGDVGDIDLIFDISDWRDDQNRTLQHNITNGKVTISVCKTPPSAGNGEPPVIFIDLTPDQAGNVETDFSTVKSLY